MASFDSDSSETHRLLSQVRQDDTAAVEQLFARHRSFLQRVVEAQIDPLVRARIDPSDVVQETQLEACRRLRDFLLRQPMSFRIWLRQMAVERLIMFERRHITAARRTIRREQRLSPRSSLMLARRFVSSEPSPSAHVSRHERIRQVRQAVTELGPRDREILLMRNVEGLSNQEVAQVLRIEPAAASQRYGRALLRLRTELIKRGLTDAEG
jgi:RNA polymerase sigma-70 factor (ECF subfamily)